MTASTTLDRALLAADARQAARRDRATASHHVRDVRAGAAAPAAGRWSVRSGCFPGVYLAGTGSPRHRSAGHSRPALRRARQRHHRCAALRRLGIRAPSIRYVDVLVPVERRRQSVEFRPGPAHDAHARAGLRERQDSLHRGGPGGRRRRPRPRPASGEVRAVVARSVQQGRCRVVGAGQRARADGPAAGSGGVPASALAEVADGVRSVTESEFRDLGHAGRAGRCRCSTRGCTPVTG